MRFQTRPHVRHQHLLGGRACCAQDVVQERFRFLHGGAELLDAINVLQRRQNIVPRHAAFVCRRLERGPDLCNGQLLGHITRGRKQLLDESIAVFQREMQVLDGAERIDRGQNVLPAHPLASHDGLDALPKLRHQQALGSRTRRAQEVLQERIGIVSRTLKLLGAVHQLQRGQNVIPRQASLLHRRLERGPGLCDRQLPGNRARRRHQLLDECFRLRECLLKVTDGADHVQHRHSLCPREPRLLQQRFEHRARLGDHEELGG